MKAMKVVQDKLFWEHLQRLNFKWMAGNQVVTSKSILTETDTFYQVTIQNNTWGGSFQGQRKDSSNGSHFQGFELAS